MNKEARLRAEIARIPMGRLIDPLPSSPTAFNHLTDETMLHLPISEGLRAFASQELTQYPVNSHEQNVAAGAHISSIRELIVDYADDHRIALTDLSEDPSRADRRLRALLTAYHRASVDLALNNWRLVPATMITTFAIERMQDQDLDDLFQEGFMALVEAAKRYDPWYRQPSGGKNPETAGAFSSFAMQTIKGKMLDATMLFSRVLTGISAHRSLLTYRKTKEQLNKRWHSDRVDTKTIVLFTRFKRLFEREPTDEELEDHMRTIEMDKKTLGSFRRSCRMIQRIIALEEIVSLDDLFHRSVRDEYGQITDIEPTATDSETSMTDVFADDIPPSPEDAILPGLLREQVDRAFAVLSQQEQEVIAYRYGLYGEMPHTQEQTGEHFRIDKGRVITVESRALRKLRHPTRSGILRDFYPDT